MSVCRLLVFSADFAQSVHSLLSKDLWLAFAVFPNYPRIARLCSACTRKAIKFDLVHDWTEKGRIRTILRMLAVWIPIGLSVF